MTLQRLDLAFKAFFRRVKAGEEPGFPRFKAKDRFPGFGIKTHGDGFRFTPGKGWRHGKLRLSGVGEMTARGEARTPCCVVCCDIQRRADGWYLSLVVACEPHRECGDREVGLDWGVETFATLAYAPGEYAEEENDRPLAVEQEALKTESRALSKALRGCDGRFQARLHEPRSVPDPLTSGLPPASPAPPPGPALPRTHSRTDARVQPSLSCVWSHSKGTSGTASPCGYSRRSTRTQLLPLWC